MLAPHTQRYVIGVDFGTLTARAVVVRVDDGRERGLYFVALGSCALGALFAFVLPALARGAEISAR